MVQKDFATEQAQVLDIDSWNLSTASYNIPARVSNKKTSQDTTDTDELTITFLDLDGTLNNSQANRKLKDSESNTSINDWVKDPESVPTNAYAASKLDQKGNTFYEKQEDTFPNQLMTYLLPNNRPLIQFWGHEPTQFTIRTVLSGDGYIEKLRYLTKLLSEPVGEKGGVLEHPIYGRMEKTFVKDVTVSTEPRPFNASIVTIEFLSEKQTNDISTDISGFLSEVKNNINTVRDAASKTLINKEEEYGREYTKVGENEYQTTIYGTKVRGITESQKERMQTVAASLAKYYGYDNSSQNKKDRQRINRVNYSIDEYGNRINKPETNKIYGISPQVPRNREQQLTYDSHLSENQISLYQAFRRLRKNDIPLDYNPIRKVNEIIEQAMQYAGVSVDGYGNGALVDKDIRYIEMANVDNLKRYTRETERTVIETRSYEVVSYNQKTGKYRVKEVQTIERLISRPNSQVNLINKMNNFIVVCTVFSMLDTENYSLYTRMIASLERIIFLAFKSNDIEEVRMQSSLLPMQVAALNGMSIHDFQKINPQLEMHKRIPKGKKIYLGQQRTNI